MNFMLVFFLLINLTFGFVKDPNYDDLEDGDLIEQLINDGKLELAADELKTAKNSDRVNFLWGRYYFAKEESDQSVKYLFKSFETEKYKDLSALYLAKNYYQQKNYLRCEEFYKKTKALKLEADFLHKSYCEFKINNFGESWATLDLAKKLFSSYAVERDFINLKIELKLFHEAYSSAINWFSQSNSLPIDYLNIAEVFHNYQLDSEAIAILELARAKYPTNSDINLNLSQLYFAKGMLIAAEEGFYRSAIELKKYNYHAAEINRQLGRYERSHFFNTMIEDSGEKLKQKIAIYVDQSKFSLIASLESVINRSELAKDDEVKYALSYSLVKMGQIDKPINYLSSITNSNLLEKSTVLRKSLLDCQKSQNSCQL